MGAPFDYAQERPEHIEQILNGLDRYNPETTSIFQDYVMEQCEKQTYDCYANLALLKLYVAMFFPLYDCVFMMNNEPQRFLLPEGLELESLRPLTSFISSI
jgi:hypothetical protein